MGRARTEEQHQASALAAAPAPPALPAAEVRQLPAGALSSTDVLESDVVEAELVEPVPVDERAPKDRR